MKYHRAITHRGSVRPAHARMQGRKNVPSAAASRTVTARATSASFEFARKWQVFRRSAPYLIVATIGGISLAWGGQVTDRIDPVALKAIALDGLVAFAITAILILIVEELNTKLRRKSDIESVLSLPTLGSVPKLPARNENRKRALSLQTQSPAFESYRAIRTSLLFSKAAKKVKSIAITSASSGDGKSTTITNLAIAFANQGVRVLVVDCDLRRGSLHRVFDLPRLPGLTHSVAGGLDLQSVVRSTSVPNLSVVTTGLQPPNPGEVVASSRLRDLLVEAQAQFDLVLIDTPPVLAAADALTLAAIAESVVLVVKVGDTTRRMAKSAHEKLQLVGARIVGSVLNDPKELLDSSEEYHYYYEYQKAVQPEAVSA